MAKKNDTMTAAERIENLKAELAKAEAEAEQERIATRQSLLDRVGEALAEFTGELEIAGIGCLVVAVVDGSITVVESTTNGHKGGKGKVTLEPGTTVERSYKGILYTLRATEQGYTVDGIEGTFTSLTAAAQKVVGTDKTLSGKAWWKIQ